ncbi:MAG: hypothetical protein M3164_07340 [Actinomycetota bacterium]|nr:hypothetical protein [Actinomycetota bacterium]
MSTPHFFGIYLNDHLAALTGGIELAKRSLANNREGQLAELLTTLSRSMEEERDIVLQLLSRTGTPPNKAKMVAAWAAERLGRLKLNGKLTAYSDLSRVVELEALSVITHLRAVFWRTVAGVGVEGDLLSGLDVDGLVSGSRQQLDGIDAQLRSAADRAFGTVSAR